MAIVEFGHIGLPFEPARIVRTGFEKIMRSRRHEKLVQQIWDKTPISLRRLAVEYTFRGIQEDLRMEPDTVVSKSLGLAYSTDSRTLPALRREIGQYRLVNRF
jgi:hypothetical protein